MSQIKTADDIKRLGTILSVWAHPDDETFSCGGLMTAAVANGQTVICITATKGETGVQDESRWPADKLGEIRAQELTKALVRIGVTKHHWLGYADGRCADADTSEAVAKIRKLIKKYQPDTVITFGPDGWTGHSDHKTVSQWVALATEGEKLQVYHVTEEEGRYLSHMVEFDKTLNFYVTDEKPTVRPAEACDIAFKLDDKLLAQKCYCLQSMPSQMERVFRQTPKARINAILCQECLVKAR